MFKVIEDISPPIVNQLFNSNKVYNLRNPIGVSLSLVKTLFSGLTILLYIGPKIWKIIPPEIKKFDSLEI